MKKKELIILVILALIISNLYSINKVRELSQRDIATVYRGEVLIDKAINEISQLEYKWDTLTVYERTESLNEADHILARTSELLNSSGKYFSPIDTYYRSEIHKLKTTLNGYNDYLDVDEYIVYLDGEFQDLWEFLLENSIVELSQEEFLKNWQNK